MGINKHKLTLKFVDVSAAAVEIHVDGQPTGIKLVGVTDMTRVRPSFPKLLLRNYLYYKSETGKGADFDPNKVYEGEEDYTVDVGVAHKKVERGE